MKQLTNTLRSVVSQMQKRQHRWLRRCMAVITAVGALTFSSHALSMVEVAGQTISWPDDGWYQVQIQGDVDSDVCQGGTSCEVEPGTYVVINITTGLRTYDVVVNAPSERPMVMGNTISWQDNGWYQVQVQGDVDSDVCQGGTSCDVEPGTYLVINLSTGERFYDVVVTGDSDNSGFDTILDTLVAAGNFTSFVAAFESLELTGILSDETLELTVFAPTDDAIAMLDPELLADLQADDDALVALLANHLVAEGVLDATALIALEGSEIFSALGGTLAVTVEEGDLFINDARVTAADIQASNGIIHAIDSVLTLADTENPSAPQSQGTILEVAESAGEFGLLLTAIETAGLTDALGNPNDFYTVFAPTDAVINALGQETLDALLSDPDALRDLLQFHLIAGTVFQSADFVEILGFPIEAANGGTLTIMDSADGLTVNGVNIVIADVAADNGVIHVIDAVLMP